jgi:hypothetical protein
LCRGRLARECRGHLALDHRVHRALRGAKVVSDFELRASDFRAKPGDWLCFVSRASRPQVPRASCPRLALFCQINRELARSRH